MPKRKGRGHKPGFGARKYFMLSRVETIYRGPNDRQVAGVAAAFAARRKVMEDRGALYCTPCGREFLPVRVEGARTTFRCPGCGDEYSYERGPETGPCK